MAGISVRRVVAGPAAKATCPPHTDLVQRHSLNANMVQFDSGALAEHQKIKEPALK
jgi:hypothetical protein